MYPGHSALLGKRLIPHLEAAGIACLDYSELFAADDKEYWIRGDGHPTGLAHHRVAKKLVQDLALAE